MWSDEQTLANAMDKVWENFFQFVEDFLAMAINFRMREEFEIFRQAEPIDSPKSSWHVMGKEEAAAFIKKHGATPL
jgi:hypothetical protein